MLDTHLSLLSLFVIYCCKFPTYFVGSVSRELTPIMPSVGITVCVRLVDSLRWIGQMQRRLRGIMEWSIKVTVGSLEWTNCHPPFRLEVPAAAIWRTGGKHYQQRTIRRISVQKMIGTEPQYISRAISQRCTFPLAVAIGSVFAGKCLFIYFSFLLATP